MGFSNDVGRETLPRLQANYNVSFTEYGSLRQ